MRKRQGIGRSTGDVAKVCDGQELVCDDQESKNAKKSEPPPARRTSSRAENNETNQAARKLQRATFNVLSLATKSSPDVPIDFGRYMISILPAHLRARSELVPFALLLMLLLVMVAYPTGSSWDSTALEGAYITLKTRVAWVAPQGWDAFFLKALHGDEGPFVPAEGFALFKDRFNEFATWCMRAARVPQTHTRLMERLRLIEQYVY